MGVKVYYAEISGHKEVKKRQQRVMMILESKLITYDAIDITEAGKESDKEFMMKNAKPRGDSKTILSPQIFNDEVYCGDYDDFDMANENDILEEFLHTEKVIGHNVLNGGSNGVQAKSSANKSDTSAAVNVVNAEPTQQSDNPALTKEQDTISETQESKSSTNEVVNAELEPSTDDVSIPVPEEKPKESNVPQQVETTGDSA